MHICRNHCNNTVIWRVYPFLTKGHQSSRCIENTGYTLCPSRHVAHVRVTGSSRAVESLQPSLLSAEWDVTFPPSLSLFWSLLVNGCGTEALWNWLIVWIHLKAPWTRSFCSLYSLASNPPKHIAGCCSLELLPPVQPQFPSRCSNV